MYIVNSLNYSSNILKMNNLFETHINKLILAHDSWWNVEMLIT